MRKNIMALILTAGVIVTSFTGCASGVANNFEKMGKGFSSSDYLVILYSGGKVVHYWYVQDKMINTEQSSDGYFWIENGKMIRVSGDIVITETKGQDINQVKKDYGLQ